MKEPVYPFRPERKISVGHYVNFFTEDGKHDLFVILNEANDVNEDLYIAIENTFDEHCSRYGDNWINELKKLERILNEIVPCGVQILTKEK